MRLAGLYVTRTPYSKSAYNQPKTGFSSSSSFKVSYSESKHRTVDFVKCFDAARELTVLSVPHRTTRRLRGVRQTLGGGNADGRFATTRMSSCIRVQFRICIRHLRHARVACFARGRLVQRLDAAESEVRRIVVFLGPRQTVTADVGFWRHAVKLVDKFDVYSR